MSFGYENDIDFVHVEKGLKFQFVVGEPSGVPEEYVQGGAISWQVYI